jgi:sigma-B regulation protein RsbU (phosphoserine phosphatase)
METETLERIQISLDEKRQNLTEFLETASEAEKDTCLCDDDYCIEEHLHIIETSLEKLENHTLGLCDICHAYVEPSRLEMDYTAHVCLDHYSDEERRRLESELELSQVVQRALLPQRIPEIEGVELAAFNRPSEIIGGDYFDFFKFRDGAHGLIIADVSGHGVSAAMLMSSLQTALRTMAPDTEVPAEILERINRFYIHNIHFTTFITVFLARFDPLTGILTYINAGHNPPVVYRRNDGQIQWLTRTAPAIGLAEDFHPVTESVTLAKGDSLLLYTDGVTEASNTQMEQFGHERLASLFAQHSTRRVPDLLQVVRQTVNEFSNHVPMIDDVTLIALKILD